MEENKLENYVPFNREEYTTDNPDYTIKQIKENYPESEGFHVETKIIDAEGPIKARGSKTVIVDIYKDKSKTKAF